MRTTAILLCVLGLAVAGCAPKGSDQHTDVFRTVEQERAGRQEAMQKQWQNTAVSVLKLDRPDVSAKPGEKLAVQVAEDGVSQEIDLSPIGPELSRRPDQERSIIRNYLRKQLELFDQEHLAAVPFDQVRGALRVMLVNGTALDGLKKAAEQRMSQTQPAARNPAAPPDLIVGQVAIDLYWVPVVWHAHAEHPAVVTTALLQRWKVTDAAVQEAAQDNLRRELSDWGDAPPVDVLELPSGRSLQLRESCNPALIILPEFVPVAQHLLQAQGPLVAFLPSADSVRIAPRDNAHLLETLLPEWKRVLRSQTAPLCESFLELDGKGVKVWMPPQPASAPVTKPATKPEIYIVH